MKTIELTIELTITQEDLEKANREFEQSDSNYNCSCLIFQAMKRANLNPIDVGFGYVIAESKHFKLDPRGKAITATTSRHWPQFVGTTFTLTEKL